MKVSLGRRFDEAGEMANHGGRHLFGEEREP